MLRSLAIECSLFDATQGLILARHARTAVRATSFGRPASNELRGWKGTASVGVTPTTGRERLRQQVMRSADPQVLAPRFMDLGLKCADLLDRDRSGHFIFNLWCFIENRSRAHWWSPSAIVNHSKSLLLGFHTSTVHRLMLGRSRTRHRRSSSNEPPNVIGHSIRGAWS